jgi:hypothetical protein
MTKISDSELQILLSQDRIRRFHNYLKTKKRFPHSGQWKPLRALFRDKKEIVQLQCGRKFAKTESAIYAAWRYAIENPGSLIYIIAPTRRQAKDIYWISKRLQTYSDPSLIVDIRENELRLVIDSYNSDNIASSIILDGCDNVNALRGINPDLVVYEEFRDHSKEFDVEVMTPNRAAKSSQLFVISTPPDNECYYTEFTEEVSRVAREPDSPYFFMEAPTSDNPFISREWLKKTEEKLTRAGQRAVWEREFLGRYIQGGATAVLPLWHKNKSKIIKPYSFLKEYCKIDYKKFNWYTFSDPGQTTFAVLLLGHNRYTGQLLFIDEVYETDREKTSAGQIWKRVQQLRKNWNERIFLEDWYNYYDPAASWFQVDIYDRFQESLIPAKKRGAKNQRDLSSPISRVKDFFAQRDTVWISENCKGFIKELDRWSYNKDGTLPDKNDHCIDLLLYVFNNLQISTGLEVDITMEDKLERGESIRVSNIRDLVREAGLQKDPFMFLGDSLFLEDKEEEVYYE